MLLIKSILKPPDKSIPIPLRFTAIASATGVAIQKKILGWDVTTLIISLEEMYHIMKIMKSLKQYGLLIKGVSKTSKNQAKEQRSGYLGMLLGELGASSLGNLLTADG